MFVRIQLMSIRYRRTSIAQIVTRTKCSFTNHPRGSVAKRETRPQHRTRAQVRTLLVGKIVEKIILTDVALRVQFRFDPFVYHDSFSCRNRFHIRERFLRHVGVLCVPSSYRRSVDHWHGVAHLPGRSYHRRHVAHGVQPRLNLLQRICVRNFQCLLAFFRRFFLFGFLAPSFWFFWFFGGGI